MALGQEPHGLQRGRRPKLFPKSRVPDPWTDKRLKDRDDDLRAHPYVHPGDLWRGHTRAGIKEYDRVHNGNLERSNRTHDRSKFFRAQTKDRKTFYFDRPIPDEIRDAISGTRIGGRLTRDDVLFVFRDADVFEDGRRRSFVILYHEKEDQAPIPKL